MRKVRRVVGDEGEGAQDKDGKAVKFERTCWLAARAWGWRWKQSVFALHGGGSQETAERVDE